VDTYLRDAAGQPTFAGQAGFASGYNRLLRAQLPQSLAKTDTKGHWDFDAAATLYRFDKDKQRTPTTATATGTGFGTAGRYAILGGTGWSTLDVKGTWRSEIKNPVHTLTFGAHDDRYKLYNPTFNTPDWLGDAPATTTVSEGNGKTRTQALFLQELWQPSPDAQSHPRRPLRRMARLRRLQRQRRHRRPPAHRLSRKVLPKALRRLDSCARLDRHRLLAKAYRFATASELYQLVTTGTTFTSPDPNLKPDDVTAAELKVERTFANTRVRVSFFEDDIHDAIIAQFNPSSPARPRSSPTRPTWIMSAPAASKSRLRAAMSSSAASNSPAASPTSTPRPSPSPAAPAPPRAPTPPSAKNSQTSPTGAPPSPPPTARPTLGLHGRRPLQRQTLDHA